MIEYTKNLSILFVEDHDELRVGTAEVLTNFFSRVDCCVNGQEALEKYIDFNNKNSTYYDIVLSDIRMPIMDGIELTEKIYNINQSQSIIILSAYDDTKYLLSLINLGIEQFIKKPIDYQELLAIFCNVSKKISKNSDMSLNQTIIKLDDNMEYNRDTRALSVKNENIYLTKFEIIFMELLTTQIGKIYANEEIVNYYTKLKENMDASNIRKLVSKLRKKLPKDSLKSIYGIGYKFLPYYKN